MKVKIFESNKIEKYVDVKFPIYRVQDFDTGSLYMKVISPNKEINIYKSDDENEYEVKIEKPSFWGSIDYLFGYGIHKLSEKKFEEILQKAKTFIIELNNKNG